MAEMFNSKTKFYQVQLESRNLARSWDDGGFFEIGGLVELPITHFDFTSEDGGETLYGTITYAAERIKESINFQAKRLDQNMYEVKYRMEHWSSPWISGGRWRLGTRDKQNIIGINIGMEFPDFTSLTPEMVLSLAPEGIFNFPLKGTITYKDGTQIKCSCFLDRTRPESDNAPRNIFYDFSDPTLWETRVASIGEMIEGIFASFPKIIVDLGSRKVEALESELAKNNEGPGSISYTLYILLQTMAKKKSLSQSADATWLYKATDVELTQMLDLYTLAIRFRYFFKTKIQKLILQSVHEHWQNGTRPALHLYRECLRLAGTNAEILQRAVLQQQAVIRKNDRYLSQPLQITSKLAALSLAPMRHLTGRGRLKPITYFSDRTYIQRLPYSDQYLLVGLSSYLISQTAQSREGSAANVTESPALTVFELMAIPHEIGHYIYKYVKFPILSWHPPLIYDDSSKTAEETTFAKLAESYAKDRYYSWCEEIFADVYGCLIAGALAVLGFQELLASGDPSKLWDDDEEHPPALIRPYFLTEILRVLSEVLDADDPTPEDDPFMSSLDRLDANWTAILHRSRYRMWGGDTRSRPDLIVLPESSEDISGTVINVAAALKALRPIIRTFVENLKPIIRQSFADPTVLNLYPWCDNAYDELTSYTTELAKITSSDFAKQFYADMHARKEMQPDPPLTLGGDVSEDDDPDKALLQIVRDWGTKGPAGGTSGGTHGP